MGAGKFQATDCEEVMELLFTEHDGTIVHICDSFDGHIVLEYGDGRGIGFNRICQKEDIGKLIETLQKAKEVIEVICEFTHNSTLYRILNKGGTYTLYILNSACIPEDPDNWYPFKQQIGSELLNAIAKALMEKK
jgi:hypothetical protein